MRPLPPALGRRTDREDVLEDVSSAQGTTMAERSQILESLCRMAAEQIAQHLDPRRTLEWQDPISPATEGLLSRLRAAYRTRG